MKIFSLKFCLIFFLFTKIAVAAQEDHGKDHAQIFHAFTVEADVGEARDGRSKGFDLSGWVGGDYNRLWLKSEKKNYGNYEQKFEVQAFYSRNFSQFFETEAQIFLSDQGNYSARFKQEVDVLLTQRLIIQPYFETEIFAQNVSKLKVKSGISDFEIGVATRYEITRKFAPYLALRYHTKTFGTADLAKKLGERVDNFIVAAGMRLRF